MDEVHSSSFKNIVQGEAVGVSPGGRKGTCGESAGLLAFPVCTRWTPGTDQPAALYQLTSKDGDSGGGY